jgi:hypothetical protein
MSCKIKEEELLNYLKSKKNNENKIRINFNNKNNIIINNITLQKTLNILNIDSFKNNSFLLNTSNYIYLKSKEDDNSDTI